jgi:[acyl-carrier-protein] S-malonyltransferase
MINEKNSVKKKIVFMFPGQGSQKMGMGIDLLEKIDRYAEYLKITEDLLGMDLKKIICGQDSEKSNLDDTRYSQIAIFTLSTAIFDHIIYDLKMDKSKISAVIGHSLGDYSALYSSGAFTFDDAAELVIFRGSLMGSYAHKNSNNTGRDMLMAAVLGTDSQVIKRVLNKYENTVFIANYNDHSQTVISGYEDQVLKASDEIKEAGAKRIIPLKVSIASHCPLMVEVSKRLGSYIEKKFDDFEDIYDLKPDFFSTTELRYINKGAIRQNLVSQLVIPVRWVDSIEKLLSDEFDVFVEIGPGKVLSGLVRRIAKSGGHEGISIFNTDSPLDMENLISFLKSNNLTAF